MYWEGWIHELVSGHLPGVRISHVNTQTYSCSLTVLGTFVKLTIQYLLHTLSRHSSIMINQWRIAYAHNKYLEQRYFSYIHYLWSRYFNTALATYVWTLGWIVQSLESSLVSCCSQCHYHHCCCCCSRTRNSGTPWKSPKECLFLSSDALPLIFLSLWHILYFLSFPCGQILFFIDVLQLELSITVT